MVITGSRKDPFLKYDRVKWIDPLLPCFFFPYCISSLPLLRASIKPGHLSFPSLDALLVESEDPKYRRKEEKPISIRRKRKQEKRTYLFPFLFFSFLFFQEISVDRRDEGVRSVRARGRGTRFTRGPHSTESCVPCTVTQYIDWGVDCAPPTDLPRLRTIRPSVCIPYWWAAATAYRILVTRSVSSARATHPTRPDITAG